MGIIHYGEYRSGFGECETTCLEYSSSLRKGGHYMGSTALGLEGWVCVAVHGALRGWPGWCLSEQRFDREVD